MNEIRRGKLFVVSGPSGAGKSTVISHVISLRDDVVFSVSATTRDPRQGEVDGLNYYFVSREEFEERIREGGFLEWAEYTGNFYGTPKKMMTDCLEAGKNVILDIDVQGAAQVKKAMPECVTIFFTTTYFSELEKRIRFRNQNSEEAIRARVEAARVEYGHAGEYDYIVINDFLESATEHLSAIITAENCRTELLLPLLKQG